ncbi:MAG: hypothetical protein E6Q06_02400 [Candidatus Moraniibacteriota bacterium]|nr:MAG: hypothetical protein E6Q06_02400 [Candidatus Moranbacteria bacterium]
MTLLRRWLGARAYQVLLAVLFLAAFLYQRETGQTVLVGQPAPPVSGDVAETEVSDGLVRVTRVIDGDTFEIAGGERVRLIGIDTPESVKPNTPVECYGKESSEYLKSLIEGKEVRLERDRTDRDRYARLLRYAYLGEVFINEKMVRDGYAESVGYKPDTEKQLVLDRAEEAARAEYSGRWATDVCP